MCPREIIAENKPLSNVAIDLVEACCILCESVGQKIEKELYVAGSNQYVSSC
jgi:hypothetical protein